MSRHRHTGPPDRALTQQLVTAPSIQREDRRAQAQRSLDTAAELESVADWYLHLFGAMPIPYIVLDPRGVIIELNPAAAALLRVDEQRGTGRPLLAHVYRDDAKVFFRHLQECERQGAATSELRLRTGDEEPRPVRLVSQRPTRAQSPQHDHHGHYFDYYFSAIWDISEDRRRYQMLRVSEARHREIIETANEGICIVNHENEITFANRRFAAMLGGSVDDLVGRSGYELVPSEEIEEARRAFEQQETGVGGQLEQRVRRLDGSVMLASVSSTVMRDERGCFTGMLRMYTDSTTRQFVADARATLMREMVAAQERERQRIARELHDQMGQHIVALSLGLARLSQLRQQTDASPIIDHLRGVVDLLGRDVHTLALELRPAALDHLGLCVALTSYAEAVAARSNLEIDVHCDMLDDLQLTTTVETGIYRIAQEALTNVVKHAQADRVSVILERRPNLLQLIIEDDGIGFDPFTHSAKLGLSGMKERAALLGGTATIESSVGNGATVYARIPFAPSGSGLTRP